ncbi:MAG: indole-3-glycerol phosphate synthase TrpC [Candidatus Aureabacteria bacterium]|nr:indole-3-glycerol phosphate synthase TrpC [Candidatus Auribacterota bacterium]
MDYSDPGRDILSEIVCSTRESLEHRKKLTPLETLLPKARGTTKRDFLQALRGEGISVIAELKKASPSAGVLRPEYDPAAIAHAYEKGGAAALSVLTEENYFQGRLAHLTMAKQAVSLPVLRKDFIIDEYQIFESAAAGADAVLLIARILSREQLKRYVQLCRELRISALVEVHTEEDVPSALGSGARIIGINNRDLKSLTVSIERSLALKDMIPPDRTIVSESGIRGRGDIERLARGGIHAVLIGEHFLRAEDPGRALTDLLRE